MEKKYGFEKSISTDMQLPTQSDAIQVLNMSYAAMAFVLEKHLPGFSHDLLTALDTLYTQNEGLPSQPAIAQLASRVKFLTSESE
ncbi:hypothetical protein [Obesumbacterium proteus]|uniref:hypothetical protein n=1 Tax=Obesumbacterium proteus TaxID=82983 RepID=UPI001F3D3087|nr:hypothetical protein [Obesumbacterium proteus]MCE9885188.1 hypothetical protein [Obesumbacterium proteus]MCE9918315.1 hypothetical protein [Obesumbacterium proteus]MCE9931854.1 hypothetical protein [Obesumbacterium proteus]MCG2878332.1 hypothetical protein [Obesumbacterium proteus]